MFRRMTIAGLAVVILIVVTVWLSGDRSAALAQQAQPPKGRAQAATQAAQPATDLKALARAAEEWVRNNPPPKTQAEVKRQVREKPQATDRLPPEYGGCPETAPDEREALGLPAPTWVAVYGKVHPAVREAFEEQRKLIANPTGMAAFQVCRPHGFQGTAYVAVYLLQDGKDRPGTKEHQTAVKEAQDRILRKRTAVEFSLFFAFKNTAGLVGYVDERGLKKLIDDEEVVAVGLDDQAPPEEPPLRERPPWVRDDSGKMVPPRQPELIGKVRASVYEALKISSDGYVYVDVDLNYPIRTIPPSDEKDTLIRRMEDCILSSLTADEFRLRGRGRGTWGYVNARGLETLSKLSDVYEVNLFETFSVILDSATARD